ncbi:alpha-L-rhamnosidase C-terminal domain-containing protein [Streptomyces sp. NPDC050759]|uniref:alpha-L-rhamnosidase C-terminal domain-containing protein n=1 Tax=Streptomyces sp. NPDC050759 TaxID=3365635 RepID=UPI0037A44799
MLTPGKPARESFVVAPVLGAHLTWASGMFDGPQGTIGVDWSADRETFWIDVTVPPGSTATVVLPDSTSPRAGPGHLHGECTLPPASHPLPIHHHTLEGAPHAHA